MSDSAKHIDPTFGRPECHPGAAAPSGAPLPKRIWADGPHGDGPVTFTCSYQSQGDCHAATLWATADGDFEVRLNNVEIGAVQPNPLARCLVRFDLSGMIKQGVNTLAIAVEPFGSGPHCMMAVMDAEVDTQVLRVVSDETWSVRTGSSSTAPVAIVGAIGAEPWGAPAGGPDDLYRGSFGDLRLLPLPVRRIVSSDAGTGQIHNIEAILSDGENAATIETGCDTPVHPPTVDLSAGWRYSHLRREFENQQLLTWLTDVRSGRPTVLIDYGLELNARLRIELAEPANATIAVITDETPQAVDGYDTAFCQVLHFDDARTATTEVTGMRYARLVFLSADRPVQVRAVSAEMVYYPVAYRGGFDCSDPLLTRIWQVSAYTLHACLQDYVWDGIKRDQLPWMGDAHLEHLGVYCAFGDVELPRRTLEFLRWHGPPETSINGIDGYTMWWVIGLYDYLLFTGDRAFVNDQRDALRELMESIDAMVEGGLYRGKSPFIDHAPIVGDEQNGHVAGTQMLLLQALKHGSLLLGVLGDPTNAIRFGEVAERVRAAALSRYWREDAGDFGPHRQVNALAIYAGVADEAQARSAAERRLADGTGNPMTTWLHYHLFEALAQAGMHQQALDIMRRYYGAMLDHDATTFWETYDLDWQGPDVHRQATTFASYGGYRISLCHGWAAGPLPWLSGQVLGVWPQRPGFSNCRIQPRPLDLKWLSGKVPTPHGEISVEAERDPAGWRLAVDVPAGIRPNLDVSYIDPLVGLTLNGQTVELA